MLSPAQLIGDIFNAYQQKKANELNYKIHRENMDFNHNEAILSFRRQQFLVDQAYDRNKPENQRKLFEEGGFNPNLIAGGAASSAVSSTSNSAPQASAPSPIQMQAVRLDMARNLAEIRNIESQTNKNNAEADVIKPNSDADIGLKGSMQKLNESLKQQTDRYVRLFDDTFEYQKEEAKWRLAVTRQNAYYLKAQAAYVSMQEQWTDTQLTYNLNYIWPKQAENLRHQNNRLSFENAFTIVANYHYLRSMAATQSFLAGHYGRLYTDDYSTSLRDYAAYQADYWGAKADNEYNGIPYLMQSTSSFSSSSSGLSFSNSSSGTDNYITNPVTGETRKVSQGLGLFLGFGQSRGSSYRNSDFLRSRPRPRRYK